MNLIKFCIVVSYDNEHVSINPNGIFRLPLCSILIQGQASQGRCSFLQIYNANKYINIKKNDGARLQKLQSSIVASSVYSGCTVSVD